MWGGDGGGSFSKRADMAVKNFFRAQRTHFPVWLQFAYKRRQRSLGLSSEIWRGSSVKWKLLKVWWEAVNGRLNSILVVEFELNIRRFQNMCTRWVKTRSALEELEQQLKCYIW